jgi:hypothetical protein
MTADGDKVHNEPTLRQRLPQPAGFISLTHSGKLIAKKQRTQLRFVASLNFDKRASKLCRW